MTRPPFRTLLVLSLMVAVSSIAEAQRFRRGGGNNPMGQGGQNGQGGQGQADPNANQSKLPDDQRLLDIHQAFVRGAVKLALEYERKKEYDKAIACYREILRLVPNYPQAQAGLAKIIAKQAMAKRVVVDIMANKGWQDTGVDLLEGKPVIIRADGHWKLNMHYPITGDGVEIPKELRQFNLGSLIGIIIPPGEKPSAKIEPPPESAESSSSENGGQPADQGGADQAQPADAAQAGASASADTSSASDSKEGSKEKEEEDKKPRPFFVGHQADLFAKASGRLYLRMYDSDTDDNVGKIRVEISGTFGPPAVDAPSSSRSK